MPDTIPLHAAPVTTKKSRRRGKRELDRDDLSKSTLADVAYRPGQILGDILEEAALDWGCSRSQAAREMAILNAYCIIPRYRPVIADMAAESGRPRDAFARVARAVYHDFLRRGFNAIDQLKTLEVELGKLGKRR